jgi:hypothetical protein
MRDITDSRLLYLKGGLFLLGAALAAAGLLIDSPTPRTAILIAVALWCSARFYYFAFYVVERYADPTFRYAGLWSLARHVLGGRRARG